MFFLATIVCPAIDRVEAPSNEHRLVTQGKEFEVVFVSLDRSQEGFDQYFETMPWLAVPFSDSEARTRCVPESPSLGFRVWEGLGFRKRCVPESPPCFLVLHSSRAYLTHESCAISNG